MDIRKISAVMMRLAAVLLILVLLSTALVSGRYARYTSTASGSGIARVARFSVTESGGVFTESVPISIIPGKRAETVIAVANDSEVAVQYTIQADNPLGNFPLTFRIQYNGQSRALPFSAALAPGASVEIPLETLWEGPVSIGYSGQVDLVEITLITTQID